MKSTVDGVEGGQPAVLDVVGPVLAGRVGQLDRVQVRVGGGQQHQPSGALRQPGQDLPVAAAQRASLGQDNRQRGVAAALVRGERGGQGGPRRRVAAGQGGQFRRHVGGQGNFLHSACNFHVASVIRRPPKKKDGCRSLAAIRISVIFRVC